MTTSEESLEKPPPVMDSFVVVGPRITAALSCFSSFLIIFIILRSRTKLLTIYHRIMFGMSFADILGTVAMGLTTLPMPATLDDDVSSSSSLSSNWEGTTLGNEGTCIAQGFVFSYGIICMFTYNGSLCVYYMCAIAMGLPEKKIARRVEPFLHACPNLAALGISILPLFLPGIDYSDTSYRAWCAAYHGDGQSVDQIVIIVSMIYISFLLGTIFICFTLIIWRSFKIEQEIANLSSSAPGEDYGVVVNAFRNTKILLIQAAAYILSFFITILPTIPLYTGNNVVWSLRLQVLVFPLQGFFNCLIFIYHKVYKYRRTNQSISRCGVLPILLKGDQEPLLFERISMIQFDKDERRINIQLENERRCANLSIDVSGSGMVAQMDNDENRDDDLSGFSALDSIESKNILASRASSCQTGNNRQDHVESLNSISFANAAGSSLDEKFEEDPGYYSSSSFPGVSSQSTKISRKF